MLKIIVTKWLQDVTFWYYKMYNQGFQHKIPLRKPADQVFNDFFGEVLLAFGKLSTVLTSPDDPKTVSNIFKKTVPSFNVPLSDGKARSQKALTGFSVNSTLLLLLLFCNYLFCVVTVL